MTEGLKTEQYDKKHRHFGGIIHPSDFTTEDNELKDLNGSYVAFRIASDLKWEQSLIQRSKRLKKGNENGEGTTDLSKSQ